MNVAMVKTLMYKDWYFLRWAIAGYIAAGVIAFGLMAVGGDGPGFAGAILLITALIGAGIHIAIATVVVERTEHTLPFIMSLPVSPIEYTTAKIAANVVIFLVPWVTLLVGAVGLILLGPQEHHGAIPYVVLILTEILLGYCIILAVALVSESMAWTIIATVFTNLLFQGFFHYVVHHPVLSVQTKGSVIVWSGPAAALLAGEVVVIALLLSATFWFQSRKTDFL